MHRPNLWIGVLTKKPIYLGIIVYAQSAKSVVDQTVDVRQFAIRARSNISNSTNVYMWTVSSSDLILELASIDDSYTESSLAAS